MRIYSIDGDPELVDIPSDLPTLKDFIMNQLIIFDSYEEWYEWLNTNYPNENNIQE